MKSGTSSPFKGKIILLFIPLFTLILAVACSPEKKAERFIKDLKNKMPSALILETNLKSETPYVTYARTQPTFSVYKHLLKTKKEDEILVQEGNLIYQTKDSIPRFVYYSKVGQIKMFQAKKGDSLLVASPVKYVTPAFDYQQDSTAWFSYERLGQLFRMRIDSLTSKKCLPENAKIIECDTQTAYYMNGDDIHLYTIRTGSDLVKFLDVKNMYPVKANDEITRLVDTEENVCFWNVTSQHIDTLVFTRGSGKYGDYSHSQLERPLRRVFYTDSQSKYIIGIETQGQDRETEMSFFIFDPGESSYYPDYLGSDYSEDGFYSYENEGRAGVISLCDDYYYTDYDYDGNVIQQRLTVQGYITENEIHNSMLLTYSEHSVCYINGSTVESFNDLEGDVAIIKSGTITTSNAGELKVSFDMDSVFPTPDRKKLIINASNPGLFESGEYLLLFDPDNRVFRQIDFGTSIYRERNRFRVKHVNNSVSYYNLDGQPVSSGLFDDISDWLFDLD